jgi:hypothetical protein
VIVTRGHRLIGTHVGLCHLDAERVESAKAAAKMVGEASGRMHVAMKPKSTRRAAGSDRRSCSSDECGEAL